MTKFTFPAYAADQSIADLTATYNAYVGPERAIKKFSDKASAMKRFGQLERQAMIDWLVSNARDGLTAEDVADRTNSQLRELIREATLPEPAPAQAEAPTPKAPSTKTKKQGIGAYVKHALEHGVAVEVIVAELAVRFPDSAPGRDAKVARKHIAWYRANMK